MRNAQRNALVALLSLPALAGVAVWPLFAMMSVMMFDAPGSQDSLATNVLFGAVLAYPLPTLIGAVLSYRNCKAERYSRCLISVPLSYAGALAILLAYGAIELFCGGSFTCK